MRKVVLLAVLAMAATMVFAPAVLAQAGQERQATLSFELAVECEPPADATFFGNVRTGEGGPGIFAQLLDPDGDGLYTGVATLPDRFGPGPNPVPPSVEPVSLPVQIVQGTGTRSTGSGVFPGEPISVVRDFGVVPIEAENEFVASVSFCEAASPTATATATPAATAAASAQYATASPTATATASPTATASVLPETGGGAGGAAGFMAIGAGALLVGGGLLARRIIR